MAIKPTMRPRRRPLAQLREKLRRIMPAGGRFLRFAGSSAICSALDQLVAWILFAVLKKPMANRGFARILLATVIARCISLTLNYALNQRLVFTLDENDPEWQRAARRESLPRYVALSTLILCLSTLGVYLLGTHFGIPKWLAKIGVDFALFFLNYNVQRKWVFRNEVSINPKATKRSRETSRSR